MHIMNQTPGQRRKVNLACDRLPPCRI
jgi:hypothetical protein